MVWIGELWNIGEMVVALWSGFQASSIALIAFGLDSGLEIFAGAVLIWSLRKEWNLEEEKATDRKALRLLGVTFFVLSAYIAIQSFATLLGWVEEPRQSYIGIVLVITSAVVMTLLYLGKTKIAKKIGSRALRAEAIETLVCDLQDVTVLGGLGLHVLFGWWWADPVAAFLLIPFLLKEGLESFREEKH
ncbi:MAG: cation transporter [Thaumarchaeota archaeon]|nr:cation transporter [Nitrososphaerota archaeon]